MIRRHVIYRGTVQGVGFRWTAVRTAAGFHVTGRVRNLADGSVELVAEGLADEVAAFCQALVERMAGCISRAETTQQLATGEFTSFDVGW